MTFASIQGNEAVKDSLAAMISSGKVPHAIMFHEQAGGDAFQMTIAFLDCLYGGNPRVEKLIHPDIHFVFPTAAGTTSEQYMQQFRELALSNPRFTEAQLLESLGIEGKNSMIAVSEAKKILEDLSLSALEGGYRSVVILFPEKMNQESSNRLLKMIEEPPAKTQFVLITHNPENVLQTISSRCQRIRIAPRQGAAQTISSAFPRELLPQYMDALVSRDLLSALEVSDRIASLPSREVAKAFCREASEVMRNLFISSQGIRGLADADEQTIRWAGSCRKTFPRMALFALSRAITLIDRNVNQKIVFTDLTDRLFSEI